MAQRRSTGEWIVLCVILSLLSGMVRTEGGSEGNKCSVISEESKPIPPEFLSVLESRSYSLIVEVTSTTENMTYYVEEVHERRFYHETEVDIVGVTMEYNGTKIVYQYYPTTDKLIVEENGKCQAVRDPTWGLPWGWKDEDGEHGAKSFGPSSILRLAYFVKTEYQDVHTPEGFVKVEVWKACDETGDVELHYHYSRPPWMMPEDKWFPEQGENHTAPVRMEVNYVDGSFKWLYTVVDFVPFVTSHASLEPPRGASCEGIVGILDGGPVPTIPNHFSLAEEVVLNSLIDGVDFGTQHIDKMQMTYAGEVSLVSLIVSLPYTVETHTSYAIKTIHDFNTGVEYIIYKEFGNCSIGSIPPFSFDSHFGGFWGSGDTFLSPNGIFHLDDKFAYVGERGSRDIFGDLWTSTRFNDIPDLSSGGLQNYAKAVLEYYFEKGSEVAPTDVQPIITDLPFRGDTFVYNKSDPTQIVKAYTTNFYDFRIVNIFSPQEFSVEECFERFDDDWSYLDIIFPATKKNQIAAASEEQSRFKHEVMIKIVKIGLVSPVRIASIDVNAGVSGVLPNTTNADIIIAKVKLLERPRYIHSFRKPMDEPNTKPGSNQVQIEHVWRSEDCAKMCITNKTLECKSFHFCENHVCYTSKLEESDGTPLELNGTCEHWVYNIHNQTVPDYPSEMVYSEVFEAVKRGEFVFDIPYKNATQTVPYEATMSLHYRSPDAFDPIRMQFTLEARERTVKNPDNKVKTADLSECLLLCVTWISYRCETVIHQRKDNMCLLLSVHYHEVNTEDIIEMEDSFVHGRTYLVDYTPIFGGVALNTTGPMYSPVEHLDRCARYCTEEKTIACQSFEYCPSNQMCHLHEEHFLDVVNSGDYTTGTSCVHFSRTSESMFTKYEDQGLTPSQHVLMASMTGVTACAKLCMDGSVDGQVCQSYDFCSICDKNNIEVCGEDNKLGVGLCFLAAHHLGEPGLALTTGKGCDHYDRNVFGDLDYPSWVAQRRLEDQPYTAGSMAGLAFGMIFLGLLLTIGLLLALTKFRPNSVPKDFELSFVALKASAASDI